MTTRDERYRTAAATWKSCAIDLAVMLHAVGIDTWIEIVPPEHHEQVREGGLALQREMADSRARTR
jgi:hypothetical protein